MGAPVTDQQQEQQPLLTVTWVDLGNLPFAPGEAQTIDDAYGQYLAAQWQAAYDDAANDALREGETSPYDLQMAMTLADEARQVATTRLDAYEQQLRAYLDTSPSEDHLADWLANRAMTDAGAWARGDALEMRHRAISDVLSRNRRAGKYRIAPDSAAEPKCQAIAGNVYDSAAEAETALGTVWHRGCIHYIEQAA